MTVIFLNPIFVNKIQMFCVICDLVQKIIYKSMFENE